MATQEPYMRRLRDEIDLTRYQLRILDLIGNDETVYFCFTHTNMHECRDENNEHNIIFYNPRIQPLVIQFINMCIFDFENAHNQFFYGCPICGNEE